MELKRVSYAFLVLMIWVLGNQLCCVVQAQFLQTTCPKVAAAKCPGLCASGSKAEKGYCVGDQCSRILAETATQQQQSPARHTAQTNRSRLPADAPPTLAVTDDPAAVAAESQPWWQQIQQQQQQQQQGLDPTADASSGVPQRVQPSQSADVPEETLEQQQAIIKHLQSLFNSGCCSSCSMANSSSSSSGGGGNVGAVKTASPSAHGTTTAPGRAAEPVAAAVDKPGAYTGPDSQVNRKLSFLANSAIKIGLDMERAGAISWLSSPAIPAPWKDANLVNIWDQGRLLQQSFYGCVDGSCWATAPWLWNPVQGGSWDNQPGLTVNKVIKPAYLYVEGYPRNWGKQDLTKEVLMTSNVTLKDNYAAVKFAMKYTGKVTHPYMTQEVPAVFVNRRLSVLAYYDGSTPWANDKNIVYAFPPGRNVYARPTELWAAYLDPGSGWGVGVFNPMAWMGITAYRIGSDDSDKPWDCSYFAHTIRMQLHQGMQPYNYTVYITVGKLDTIRATFYKIKALPGVMPSTKGDTQEPQVPGPTEGQPSLGRNALFGTPTNYSSFGNVIAELINPAGSNGYMQGGVTATEAPGVAAAPAAATAATAAATATANASQANMTSGRVGAGGVSQAEADTLDSLGSSGGLKPSAATDREVTEPDPAAATAQHSTKTIVVGVMAAVAGCALLAGAVVATITRRKQLAGGAGGGRTGAGSIDASGTVAGSTGAGGTRAADHEAAGQAGEAATVKDCQAVPAGSDEGLVSSEGVVAALAVTPGVMTRGRAALALAQEEARGSQ